jgi:hypothetical protein
MDPEVQARVRATLQALRSRGVPGVGNFTDAEIDLHARNPRMIPGVFAHMLVAWVVARALFSVESCHNGPGDAFRHAFWSAMVARTYGQSLALEYTSAHENYEGNPPEERAMDLHNNAAGAAIGGRLRGTPFTGDTVLAVAVLAALRGGTLRSLHQ